MRGGSGRISLVRCSRWLLGVTHTNTPFSSHWPVAVRRRRVEGCPLETGAVVQAARMRLRCVLPDSTVSKPSRSAPFLAVCRPPYPSSNVVPSCKLPNIDQTTGERHPTEPDKTLRTQRNVDEGAPKLGCLGMNLTPLFPRTDRPEAMESVVEVGMAVQVLERGRHRYIPM